MTSQESFKRRIRERMATTGERYMSARQVLLDQAEGHERRWVSPPEFSNDAVTEATGKGWNEWCDVIEAWDGHTQGHTAIAAYLVESEGVGAWWAQSVTVGYERITGLRLPYQRPDGTFTAGKSKTVTADGVELRLMLLGDDGRRDLFPGWSTTLRSKPASKAIRIEIGPGIAQIAIDPKSDGRCKVTVAHEGLPTFDDVEEWKFYWSDWLDAIDGA